MNAQDSWTAPAVPITRRFSWTQHVLSKSAERVGRDTVDFFFSVAVFQHFPSKAYTKDVLEAAAGFIRKGGHALVQVRYFDGSEKLRQKEGDYAKNVIYMTSFTTGEFSALLAEAGFALLGSKQGLDDPEDCHDKIPFSGNEQGEVPE